MFSDKNISWDDSKVWGQIPVGQKVNRGNPIFPRLDIKKELERLDEANSKLIEERNAKKGKEILV